MTTIIYSQTFIFVIFIVESNYHLPTKVVKVDFCVWMLLLPKANGRTYIDFGCTHPIDGLFWSLPIYLLGFFPKYECWVTNLIMLLYHFIFLGWHLPFVSQGFISVWNVKTNSYFNFLNDFFLINIQIIIFNSFKSY